MQKMHCSKTLQLTCTTKSGSSRRGQEWSHCVKPLPAFQNRRLGVVRATLCCDERHFAVGGDTVWQGRSVRPRHEDHARLPRVPQVKRFRWFHFASSATGSGALFECLFWILQIFESSWHNLYVCYWVNFHRLQIVKYWWNNLAIWPPLWPA